MQVGVFGWLASQLAIVLRVENDFELVRLELHGNRRQRFVILWDGCAFVPEGAADLPLAFFLARRYGLGE